MKKLLPILAIVFALAVVFSISVFALNADADGVFEIASADDLIEFRNTATNGAKAKLTADIDMTGKEWTPFSRVVINLDGQGHSITGLSATVSDKSGNIGLFVDFLANNPGNPTIQNITFKDSSFTVNNATGTCQIGFVAGYADRANVTGITLDGCTMTVNHSGDGELSTGMIVGRAEWSAQGNEIKVDGIVNANCTLTVNADAKNNTYVGGIVGSHASDTLAIRNAQFNGTINGTVDSSRFAAIACQMWGSTVISNSSTTTNLPLTLSAGNVKEVVSVGTPEALNAVVDRINNGLIGYADITLTADLDYTDKVWTPIGGNYKGVFDGAGYTITGMKVVYDNAPAGDYGIIVRRAANSPNGTIKNLTLKDSSITVNVAEGTEGGVFVGGVMGYYDRGHAENLTLINVDVALNGKTAGEIGVGGICGKAEWAGPRGAVGFYSCTTDKDSSVYMNAGDSTNARAGGIVGRAGSADRYEIDNCVNNATVWGSHTAAGIIGASGHWNNPANAVKNSKNYGNVYGKNIAASLVGVCDGATLTVDNCVAGGFISGEGEVCANVRADFIEETLTNVKTVSIITTANDDDITGYYQLQSAGDGLKNIRVIFMTSLDYVTAVDELNIQVVFTKDDATVKTYNGKLGNEVYKSVTADGDVYNAPEDIVLFGNIFTGVPTAEANGFTITVTDGEGTTVYEGAGVIG